MPDIKDQQIELLQNMVAMLNAQLNDAKALIRILTAKVELYESNSAEMNQKLDSANAKADVLLDANIKANAKIDELLASNKDANARVNELLDSNKKANARVDELLSANMKAMEKSTELLEKIAELTAQNKSLREKQSLDSSNSSKPPSSDGLAKNPVNKDRSLRGKSGKKQGGQPGHKGSTYMATREPDNNEPHMPKRCSNCPNYDKCLASAKIGETRTVVEIQIKTIHTAHHAMVVTECPLCHKKLKGEFPADIKAPLQYGNNLCALVASLSTLGAVSMKRIQEILGNVLSIPLSTGTISSIVSKAAGKVGSALNVIREKLLGSDVTHSDETGFRVDGKTRWAHVLCTDDYTYLRLSNFRGHKGMDEIGLLPMYKGINVHDCWASYWKYDEIIHAICNAHILRELNFVTDNYPDQTWNGKFRTLLLEMKSEKEKAIAEGKQELSEELKKRFLTEYDEIIRLGYEENPLPADDPTQPRKRGRKSKGKVRSLIERLATNKEAVCLFAMDFRVPFDNNSALCESFIYANFFRKTRDFNDSWLKKFA